MNLSNEQIETISKGIKKSKVLPRQPYVKEELEKKGFKNLPKKDPFFYIDEVSVNIAGDFQKGCLLVHLDGLYSNCVPDSPDDELKLIMPWDSIYDILVNDSKTARAMPDGLTELLLLTDDNKNPEEAQCLSIIMKSPSKLNSPFSVIKSIYDNIWKRMIDKYRGQPIIWGSHIDWFTQETFFSKEEFIGFYTDEVYEDDGGDFSKEITQEMIDDGYTGQGTATWPDGDIYAGEWKDGQQNGKGTFISSNGEYTGEFKDGKSHGYGKMTYSNGAVYDGEWKDSAQDGQGTVVHPSGNKYTGEFKDGKQNGHGTGVLSNGDKYVGEWKGGKRHGQGTYTFAVDGSTNEGLFENGHYIGENSEEPKAKEEACIKGLTTPLAEISYIFLSFAHFTDGEVSKEERIEAMTNSMQMAHKWSYTKDEAVAAWVQASNTHAECETIKDIFSIYIDVLNTLGSREFFDNEQKNELIVRLESIMNVDHVQHENEIMWINKIKEIWKLEEDSSQDSSDEEKSVLEKAMEGITKKDLAEKIVKNIEVSTENPEAYAFLKSVSSKNADYNKVEEQLKNGTADFIEFADEDGYTALHYACWDNKLKIVGLLIEEGANVNAVSSMSETPLQLAVVSGHVDVVKFLFTMNDGGLIDIDFEIRGLAPNPFHPKEGATLLRDAVLNNHWDIINLLLDQKVSLSPLTELCSIGIDGETNFFTAIEKFCQKENKDYNKERLDALRSVVEGEKNYYENKKKTTKKKSEVKVSEEDNGESFSLEITDKMQDDGYTGKGCYFYGDRAKYVGEYKDGKMHGQGTYTYGKGAWEGATYVGEFSNDVFNGQGTLTLPNGDKHVGEFKDDKRNGQGTYTFANGTIQEGLFENDKYIGEDSGEPKAEKKYQESSTQENIESTPNPDTPIWEIIQYEFNNLGKESVVKKEFSEMILSKYSHIKKGTLGAQISIQVINKRSRTNYNQCGKERVCGDDKFDFLFEQEDKTLCKYDKSKHGIWEIYKRDDGKLDVRIVKN